jgi:prevent-host-death family protein
MCHMKTASIREVRHDFGRILEWVANGEEVSITKHRQPVARLLPVTPKKASPGKMPDVTARLQKVFGRKVIPNKEMRKILAENRGNW